VEIFKGRGNRLFKKLIEGDVMFKYVSDVSNVAQDIVKRYCTSFDCAIDATLGNGHDTDFLIQYFDKIYSFDIQSCAIENYKERCSDKVTLIHDSHEFLDKYINNKVDCVMYNLGYLPGGDKNITTEVNSTINSIKVALKLLKDNGLMTICIYNGHSEGKLERDSLMRFLSTLSKKDYGVMLHNFFNRTNAPELMVIEKKNKGVK
jgi:hypothetical protein